jgi:hypothetical protein
MPKVVWSFSGWLNNRERYWLTEALSLCHDDLVYIEVMQCNDQQIFYINGKKIFSKNVKKGNSRECFNIALSEELLKGLKNDRNR